MDRDPATPNSIAVFHDFIGLTSSVRDYSGRALSASPVPPGEVLLELGGPL